MKNKHEIKMTSTMTELTRPFNSTFRKPTPLKVAMNGITGKHVVSYSAFDGKTKAMVMPEIADAELMDTVRNVWYTRELAQLEKVGDHIDKVMSLIPSEVKNNADIPAVEVVNGAEVTTTGKDDDVLDLLNEKVNNQKPSYEALLLKARLAQAYHNLYKKCVSEQVNEYPHAEEWDTMANIICDLIPYVQADRHGNIKPIPESIKWHTEYADKLIEGTTEICKEWDREFGKDGDTVISGKSKQAFADALRKGIGHAVPSKAVVNLPMADVVKVWKLTQSALKVDKSGCIVEDDILRAAAIRQVVLAWAVKYNAKLK